MADEKKPGLAGKDYGALFRSDREPRRVEFTVDGRECYVVLLAMGKNARDEFVRRSGGVASSAAPDLMDAMTYMVGQTLTDCCLWGRQKLKGGALGDWQQIIPPANRKDLYQWLKSEFDALAEFWDDLVAECSVENGFTEPAEGN